MRAPPWSACATRRVFRKACSKSSPGRWPSAALFPAAHHRDLILHAHVESCHVDDHALVRAVADRFLLVRNRDAEGHGASSTFTTSTSAPTRMPTGVAAKWRISR